MGTGTALRRLLRRLLGQLLRLILRFPVPIPIPFPVPQKRRGIPRTTMSVVLRTFDQVAIAGQLAGTRFARLFGQTSICTVGPAKCRIAPVITGRIEVSPRLSKPVLRTVRAPLEVSHRMSRNRTPSFPPFTALASCRSGHRHQCHPGTGASSLAAPGEPADLRGSRSRRGPSAPESDGQQRHFPRKEVAMSVDARKLQCELQSLARNQRCSTMARPSTMTAARGAGF
jgi:hypothetical protein